MKTQVMRRSGFTIVELLVVVAIIIVLAALSMVFMRRGRAAADEVRCMNNIRQICGDHLALSEANNGYIVHPYRSKALGSWSRNWAQFHTILRNDDMGWRENGDKVRERMETMNHLRCPTAYKLHRAEMDEETGHKAWRSYMINGRIGTDKEPSAGDRGWIDGAATILQVMEPSKLVFVSERTWNGSVYPAAGGPWPGSYPYADFHGGGFHVGYLDGHVQKWTNEKFLLGGVTLPNGQEGKWSNPEFSLMWRGTMFKRSLPD